MYIFNCSDAWILAAIYRAGTQGQYSYTQIIASLPKLGRPLPTHAECKTAYDKFLYLGLIVADGANTSLSAVAETIVKTAQAENGSQWIAAIEQQLAPYKLKSMCNRFEWTEAEYWRGVELFNAH